MVVVAVYLLPNITSKCAVSKLDGVAFDSHGHLKIGAIANVKRLYGFLQTV